MKEEYINKMDEIFKYRKRKIKTYGPLPIPDFIGVGAGRCGTSSLSLALQSHENIYPKIKRVKLFRY